MNDRMIRTGPPRGSGRHALTRVEQEAKIGGTQLLVGPRIPTNLPFGHKKVKGDNMFASRKLTDEAKAARVVCCPRGYAPRRAYHRAFSRASTRPRSSSRRPRRDATVQSKPRDPSEKTFLQKKKEEEKARKEARGAGSRAHTPSKWRSIIPRAGCVSAELEQKKKAKWLPTFSAAAELRAKEPAAALKAKKPAAARRLRRKAKIGRSRRNVRLSGERTAGVERKKKDLEDARS